MKPFIPQKFEFLTFGLLLSGMMSCIVTFIANAMNAGFHDHFVIGWIETWLSAWLVAFPVVLVVAPLVRKTINKLVIPTSQSS